MWFANDATIVEYGGLYAPTLMRLPMVFAGKKAPDKRPRSHDEGRPADFSPVKHGLPQRDAIRLKYQIWEEMFYPYVKPPTRALANESCRENEGVIWQHDQRLVNEARKTDRLLPIAKIQNNG